MTGQDIIEAVERRVKERDAKIVAKHALDAAWFSKADQPNEVKLELIEGTMHVSRASVSLVGNTVGETEVDEFEPHGASVEQIADSVERMLKHATA